MPEPTSGDDQTPLGHREWRIPPRLRPAILAVAVLASAFTLGTAALVWPSSPVATPVEACFEPQWRGRIACRILAPAPAAALPDSDTVWTAAVVHQLETPDTPLPESTELLVDQTRATKGWLEWRRLSQMRDDLDLRDAFVAEHGAEASGALEVGDLTARSHRLDEIAAWRSVQPDPFADEEAMAVIEARRSWVASALAGLSFAILLLGVGLFRWQRTLPVVLTAHALHVGKRRILLEQIREVSRHQAGVTLLLEDGATFDLGQLPPDVLEGLLHELDRMSLERGQKAESDAERRRLAALQAAR